MTPILNMYYQMEIRDTQTQKLIRRTRKYRSRSFVGNFLKHIRGLFLGNTNIAGVIDTTNTSRTLRNPGSGGNWMIIDAFTTDNDDEGIVVGSGTTAVDMSDFAMATLIVDGSSSGQLIYDASSSLSAVSVGALQSTFTITKSFGNTSGGDVSVNETGIICGTVAVVVLRKKSRMSLLSCSRASMSVAILHRYLNSIGHC